jgi:hypothetical protein
MPDLGSLGAYLPDIPLDEVIRPFRPADIENDGNRSVAWFAEWLARYEMHGRRLEAHAAACQKGLNGF